MANRFGIMLLSTLAALVILTHSAEEESERIRPENSPRYFEAESSHEKPWRSVNIQQQKPEELQSEPAWPSDPAPDQPLRRRRPGRKRRRRPSSEDEDNQPQIHYLDEPIRGYERDEALGYNLYEQPRRRRKRPEAVYQEEESNRLRRRRGQRRRQRPYLPDLENSQKEFPVERDIVTEPPEPTTVDETQTTYHEPMTTYNDEYNTYTAETLPQSTEQETMVEANTKHLDDKIKNDKTYRVPYGTARKQIQSNIEDNNATILKELLKETGGLSLSEVLQQNNLSLSDLLTGKHNAISAIKQVKSTTRETTPAPRVSEFKREEAKETTTVPTKGNRLQENRLQQSDDLEEELVKESQPAKTVRRRLPPIASRRNVRQRINLQRSNMSGDWRSNSRRRQNVTSSTTEPTITEPYKESNDAKSSTVSIMTTVEIATETSSETSTTQLTENEFEKITNQRVIENQINREREQDIEVHSEPTTPILKSKYKPIKRPTIETFKNELDMIEIEADGIENMISSSEQSTKQQATEPPVVKQIDEDDIPDMIEIPASIIKHTVTINNGDGTRKLRNKYRKNQRKNHLYKSTEQPITETEAAKNEILEILEDTNGGERLSKILSERNMSLNELVELRERGSSHIHLADIFHNTSKEPNPPEPFLSKSLIEPMSKETYPLKVLLEANLHDPNAKTAIKAGEDNTDNIPFILNYGKNINEYSENLGNFGIISLFSKNKSKNLEQLKERPLLNYREGRSDFNTNNDTKPSPSDIVTKTHHALGEKDIDGDGIIVLDDIQRQREIETADGARIIVSNRNKYESYGKIPESLRSVIITCLSLVAATILLFLLTYGFCKWNDNRRKMIKNEETFHGEPIPTPVFESRKANKHNCSTRSISPMLVSNIYTVSGGDSGKESPDYTWDSLQKPFQ